MSHLSQDFQFFPPQLAQLQERELAVFKVGLLVGKFGLPLTSIVQRQNGIVATIRESTDPEDTPEKLEEERQAAQEFIDTGKFLRAFRFIFSSPLSRTSDGGGDGPERRIYCRRLSGMESSRFSTIHTRPGSLWMVRDRLKMPLA